MLENQIENRVWLLTILAVSIAISIIKNLAPYHIIASWDIISYLLLLLPLIHMINLKQIANPYAKWVVLFLLVLIFDIYYYSNTLASEFLPLVVYATIGVLYMGSMQKMEYFFQVVIPKLKYNIKLFYSMGLILRPIVSTISSMDRYKESITKNTLYMRIGFALLITLPMVGLFLALFMASDPNFSHFIEELFSFQNPFKAHHIVTIPILFFIYIFLFGYAISNVDSRSINLDTKPFDPIIIGIFFGALNFLFVSFLFFQIVYLFGGEEYILQRGISLSSYARSGFFELATVMGIVLVIFLIVIYRYKYERLIAILMSGLMLQTLVIGYASLEKMYLYQSMMGATVLRYYIEWFDYFLLLILLMGVVYLFSRRPFYEMLNSVVVLGMVSFATISSLNIDGMVARQNITQFASNPKKLDRSMIADLSIDALPYIQGSDIKIDIYDYSYRDCTKFNNYHWGYCSRLAKYGKGYIDYITFDRGKMVREEYK